MPHKNLYDPTGCLRQRRIEQAAKDRVLNSLIGFGICLTIVGGAWLILHFVHV